MANRRAVMAGAPAFNAEAWKKAVVNAVMTGVRISAEKALASAVEDAPVRDVFKHGHAYRRRGLRARRLTLEEASSEDSIRRLLRYRTKSGNLTGLARAEAGTTRTRGRPAGKAPAHLVSGNINYLRRAATRKGNPNSFAPFVIRRGTTRADEEEARAIFKETQELGFGRGKKFEFEHEKELRGGRELTKSGQLRYRPARYQFGKKTGLHARGEFERRTGRANFTKDGVTTLGGRLRGEIALVGPVQYLNRIRANVVSPTPYAKYQEFGTRHNRATPYMRPALLKLVGSYRNEIVKALNKLPQARPDAGEFD